MLQAGPEHPGQQQLAWGDRPPAEEGQADGGLQLSAWRDQRVRRRGTARRERKGKRGVSPVKEAVRLGPTLRTGQVCRVTADSHRKGRAAGSRSRGERLASGRVTPSRGSDAKKKAGESDGRLVPLALEVQSSQGSLSVQRGHLPGRLSWEVTCREGAPDHKEATIPPRGVLGTPTRGGGPSETHSSPGAGPRALPGERNPTDWAASLETCAMSFQ